MSMTGKRGTLAQEAQKNKSVIDNITQTPEEKKKAADLEANMTTRGNHVGAKLSRINVAFSTDNFHYLHVMSGLQGDTLTGYVNKLVEADRAKHDKTYQKALKLSEEIKDEN